MATITSSSTIHTVAMVMEDIMAMAGTGGTVPVTVDTAAMEAIHGMALAVGGIFSLMEPQAIRQQIVRS